ncbi:MAG: hypothetical protein N2Z58_07845 [Fervidobacterium sp.]|nr:hypothetical protein [Fervidobacterium sp.]
MALNKRTVILLVVAILIWVVVIFVLIKMNTKPNIIQTTQTNSQSGSVQTMTQSSQESTNSQLENVSNISLAELENMIPESTFSDFFSPFKLDLKVSLKDSLFADQGQKKTNEETLTQYYENIQKTESQVVKPSLSESVSLSARELTELEGIYYVGYISIEDNGRQMKKVYVQTGDEVKSALENELIDGKYKVLQVNPTFVVVLDTTDGKIKKIRYLEQ